MKKIVALSISVLILLNSFGCTKTEKKTNVLKENYDGFIAKVDSKFAYDIAYNLSTNPELFNNQKLGGRTAGSDAEHRAADYLVSVMEDIGLENITKEGVNVDKWQFNGASLTIDGKDYPIYSYATASTPKEGILTEIVYVNKGTMWDYENIDVKGKIVLIDIDQRADWWITYPMLEAEHQGAAAIIAANIGGFAQVADDALNSQDICGPTSIPTLSIGVADAKEIQEKIADGKVEAKLVVDNVVEIGTGTSYNVMGMIKGESSENRIILGAHYDVHFWGFQDDSCADGLVLSVAKAMVDSGYKPKNDIVFVLHGSEEWGSSYTQFDWTVGAWEMINTAHPEWIGTTKAFINFELPAYEFDTYTSTYSAPEMYSMLDYFANEYEYSPDPVNCFPDGVLTEGYQTYTYSDDFSYYKAGVPSTVNGFLLQKDMENVFPFYIDYYHTQYDTYELYDEDVMDFNTKYYGSLAMYIDQMPAEYLDFSAQYDRILASISEETMKDAGVDIEKYKDTLEKFKVAADNIKNKVEKINKEYILALEGNNQEKIKSLWEEGKLLSKINLEAFKYAQENLLGLMYERPIVPHEGPQENIEICNEIISLLEKGDLNTAVDEYAYAVNNVLEWYAMYFSPEVIAIQDDMNWGEGNKDNNYWGTDINFVKANVDEATRSLFVRYGEENGDFSKEIEIYKKSNEEQKLILLEKASKEIEALEKLTEMLK